MTIYQYPQRSEWADIIKRPTFDNSQLRDLVSNLLDDIRHEGDAMIRQLEAQFDHCQLTDIQVSDDEFKEASQTISEDLAYAIRQAAHNISRFHESQRCLSYKVETQRKKGIAQKGKIEQIMDMGQRAVEDVKKRGVKAVAKDMANKAKEERRNREPLSSDDDEPYQGHGIPGMQWSTRGESQQKPKYKNIQEQWDARRKAAAKTEKEHPNYEKTMKALTGKSSSERVEDSIRAEKQSLEDSIAAIRKRHQKAQQGDKLAQWAERTMLKDGGEKTVEEAIANMRKKFNAGKIWW
jgi:hypothetical protein